jgi:two-component system, chemotaxis family, protein-glutamate methylesterase/glutaminase
MAVTARNVVAVGASAGGVEALQALVAGLPPDLPAAVLVVLHLSPGGTSALGHILDRAGPLPARTAEDGAPLLAGEVYAAPPNRHLMMKDGRLELSSGPTENGHRPAIDVLLRSAAYAFGPRAVGVILSGTLDDGVAGLAAIAARGGATVVQDPDDAQYRSMPENALRWVHVDQVLPADKIGTALGEILAARQAAAQNLATEDPPAGPPALAEEVDIARHADENVVDLSEYARSTQLSCPDCGGTLVELNGQPPRYRCHVGHGWSGQSLLNAQSQATERALWVALRSLEEKARLGRRIVSTVGASSVVMERYEQTVRECEDAASELRTMLLSGMTAPEE